MKFILLSALFGIATAVFMLFYLFQVLGHLHVTPGGAGSFLLHNSGAPLKNVQVTARLSDGGVAATVNVAQIPRGETVLHINLPADAHVTGVQVRGRRFGFGLDHFACLEIPAAQPQARE